MIQRQNSSRPYTSGSFKTKLQLFDQFIKEFTYVDEELNPEERRQILQDRLTNGMVFAVLKFDPRFKL